MRGFVTYTNKFTFSNRLHKHLKTEEQTAHSVKWTKYLGTGTPHGLALLIAILKKIERTYMWAFVENEKFYQNFFFQISDVIENW